MFSRALRAYEVYDPEPKGRLRMNNVPEIGGSMGFDDRMRKARLSAEGYNSRKQTIRRGKRLNPSAANAAADTTKDPDACRPFPACGELLFGPNGK